MYCIDPKTKDAIFDLLDLVHPCEEIEKVELLRKIYEPLQLHELPLSLALFVFDTARLDFKSGIKMKEILSRRHHWFEAIHCRITLIGIAGLVPLVKFLKSYEEADHELTSSKKSR